MDVTSAVTSDVLQPLLEGNQHPEAPQGRRKPRRRSIIGFQVKKPEDIDLQEKEREKQVEKIYKNQTFDPPETKEFETIFEGNDDETAATTTRPRGAAAASGLVIGKYKSKRFLEPSQFWVEDKDKSRHRAKMSKKALKGKLKLKALTPEEEEKLKKLIEEKSEDEDDMENEIETKRKLPKENKKPETFKTPEINLSRRSSASRSGKRTAEKVNMNDSQVIPSLMTPTFLSQIGTPPNSAQRSKRLNFDPGESQSFNVNPSAVMSQEEFRRQIEEADSLFGQIAPDEEEEEDLEGEYNIGTIIEQVEEASKRKKPRRDSVSIKVRRSSRFMKHSHSDAEGGSIYQLEDMELSKLPKKQRRRMSGDLEPRGFPMSNKLYSTLENDEDVSMS